MDGGIAVRTVMNLSSSFDHRFVDGYDAASLVQELKALLEHPGAMFLGDFVAAGADCAGTGRIWLRRAGPPLMQHVVKRWFSGRYGDLKRAVAAACRSDRGRTSLYARPAILAVAVDRLAATVCLTASTRERMGTTIELAKNRMRLPPMQTEDSVDAVGCLSTCRSSRSRVHEQPVVSVDDPVTKPEKVVEKGNRTLAFRGVMLGEHKPVPPHVYGLSH